MLREPASRRSPFRRLAGDWCIRWWQSEQQQQQLQQRWSRTLQAAASLQLQQTETEALWAVLAAILHLGRAGVTKGRPPTRQLLISRLVSASQLS